VTTNKKFYNIAASLAGVDVLPLKMTNTAILTRRALTCTSGKKILKRRVSV
jgi:hypothetical protein